jgi:hypothetical protein
MLARNSGCHVDLRFYQRVFDDLEPWRTGEGAGIHGRDVPSSDGHTERFRYDAPRLDSGSPRQFRDAASCWSHVGHVWSCWSYVGHVGNARDSRDRWPKGHSRRDRFELVDVQLEVEVAGCERVARSTAKGRVTRAHHSATTYYTGAHYNAQRRCKSFNDQFLYSRGAAAPHWRRGGCA